ncbi:MAG: DUF4153 domain-containing protein, partial [Lachnospiraceae bacterium]|nr:DUF4153 domain-containing protein [Lachnospiraceae bacterium]
TNELRKTHPYTFVALMIATFSGFFWMLAEETFRRPLKKLDIIKYVESPLEHLLLWGFLLIVLYFFLDTVMEKSIKKTMIALISAGALLFYAGIVTEEVFGKSIFNRLNKIIGTDRLLMYTGGFVLVFALLGVYYSYKKLEGEYTFSEYVMGVVSRSFLVGVIYSVVLLGLMTLTFIFTQLLFGNFEDIFLPLFVLVTGFYLTGSFLSGVASSTKEIPKFVEILFKYVLYIMVLAAYLILYIYFIKIIALSAFPSNIVYGILTFMFSFSMPLAYLNLESKEKFIGVSARILPFIHAPLLFLQLYCVGVRIGQYGLTPSRFMGCIFIVVEIVYIVLYLIKKEKVYYCLPVFAIMGFLAFIMPVTNILSVPKISQTHVIDRLVDKEENKLTEHEHGRLYAAYNYLCRMDNGRIYLEKRYNEEQLEYLGNLKRNDSDNNTYNTEYRYFQSRCKSMDVSGYGTVTPFRCYDSVRDAETSVGIDVTDLTLEKITFGSYYDEEYEKLDHFDASAFVSVLMDSSYDINKSMFEATLPDYKSGDAKVVITDANISYDPVSEKIISLNINGYIIQ